MIARALLLLLACGVLAPCSRAGRVRVEFEASLSWADVALVDPSRTLTGFYEFDTAANVTVTNASELLSSNPSYTRSPLQRFSISSEYGSVVSTAGLAYRRENAFPTLSEILGSTVIRDGGEPERLRYRRSSRRSPLGWSVLANSSPGGAIPLTDESFDQLLSSLESSHQIIALGAILLDDSDETSGFQGPIEHLVDGHNETQIPGPLLARYDLNGDGIIEYHESTSVLTKTGVASLQETPFFQSEAALDLTPLESPAAIESEDLTPPSLEDLALATLTISHRLYRWESSYSGDGFLAIRPHQYEAQYEITSLRVISVPEPSSLLLATGLAALGLRDRRHCC